MAKEGKKKIYLTDEEKYDLICLWEGDDVLYGVTNVNNNKRNAALKRINDETDVDISVGQLEDTMKSLRTTFLKEKRNEEDTKVTGTGRGQLYESSWKLFKELHFFTPFTRH